MRSVTTSPEPTGEPGFVFVPGPPCLVTDAGMHLTTQHPPHKSRRPMSEYVPNWRDRIVVSLANGVLRLATPEYQEIMHQSLVIGLREYASTLVKAK